MTGHRPPIETDPLGAIRKELLTAAWRKKAVDDRRRRLLASVSAVLTMLVFGAGGVSALGVDVPVIGDAIDRLVARHEDRAAPGRPGPGLPASVVEVKPGPGNTSEVLRFPWGDDSGTAAAAAYLNTQEQICFVVVTPEDRGTGTGCLEPVALADKLDEGVAYPLGLQSGRSIVVTGYVAPEIDHIRVLGPQGQLEVQLAAPWRPDSPGASAVRAFVATIPSPAGGRLGGADTTHVLNLDSYSIDALLADGRRVTVHP